MKKTFDLHGMLRLEGQKPTPREEWIAFHRLWRCTRHDYRNHAIDCFRVLAQEHWWPWILLMNEEEDTLGSARIPKFIRQERVRLARERRTRSRMARLMRAIFSDDA